MAMAKFTVDGPSKLFIAKPGVVEFDAVIDLYSDAKEHWIDTTDNRFMFPIIGIGGNPIDPIDGTFIPGYFYLTNGWRIRPQEAHHTLKVTGGILLVDGGGDPFVNTLAAFIVRVLYQQPVQAITVATGGGGACGLTASEATKLDELWKVHGLSIPDPLVVSPSARDAGAGISQNIGAAGDVVTVTRNP